MSITRRQFLTNTDVSLPASALVSMLSVVRVFGTGSGLK